MATLGSALIMFVAGFLGVLVGCRTLMWLMAGRDD